MHQFHEPKNEQHSQLKRAKWLGLQAQAVLWVWAYSVVSSRSVLQNGCNWCTCVLAVWKHHIINVQEQHFLEVLRGRSSGPLVTAAFAARATWEADSTCSTALPTAETFYSGSMMKGWCIASQHAALYRFVSKTEAFFCKGCGISKADCRLSLCWSDDSSWGKLIKFWWWGKSQENISDEILIFILNIAFYLIRLTGEGEEITCKSLVWCWVMILYLSELAQGFFCLRLVRDREIGARDNQLVLYILQIPLAVLVTVPRCLTK